MPPDAHRYAPLRPLPIHCQNCGWSLNLVASEEEPENYDITPLDGWEVAGDRTVCERCAVGWQPMCKKEHVDA